MQLVGWVERSETQQLTLNIGFRSLTQPTQLFQITSKVSCTIC